MSSLERIFAVVEREFCIARRLKWRILESLFFPITSILIWGLFALWAKQYAFQVAFGLLAVNIYLGLSYTSQSNANMGIMDDRWSDSIQQIMLSPIRPLEYLFGKILWGVFLSLATFAVVMLMSYFVFKFGLAYSQATNLFILMLVTIIFSVSLSIFIEASILVLGAEWGFLAYATIQIVMLFSAPFFSVSTYPFPIQLIAKFIPYTWVFESLRTMVAANSLPWNYVATGLGLSLFYLVISLPFYLKMFDYARKIGKLTKMW